MCKQVCHWIVPYVRIGVTRSPYWPSLIGSKKFRIIDIINSLKAVYDYIDTDGTAIADRDRILIQELSLWQK